MAFDIPNKEQILFSNLCTIHTLLECIRDNIDESEFEDIELENDLNSALAGICNAYYRMRYLIKRTQEPKNACY